MLGIYITGLVVFFNLNVEMFHIIALNISNKKNRKMLIFILVFSTFQVVSNVTTPLRNDVLLSKKM